jgi:methionyl-tRNA formyltransferase
MRLVYFAFEPFSIPALISLVNSDHEVLAVVTRATHEARQAPDCENSVSNEARKFNLPLIVSEGSNPFGIIQKVQDLKADATLVSCFGEELPEPLRCVFPAGSLEIHPSLLPKYRGPNPIQWAIHHKERKTGVTVFRVTDEPYAGPIIVQRETMIKPGETFAELEFRLARIACDALDATLKKLEKNPHVYGVAQDESEVSWAPELKEGDAHRSFD